MISFGLQQATFNKAQILPITNDYMVEDADTHDLSSLPQSAGDGYILATWRWISTWVLMDQN